MSKLRVNDMAGEFGDLRPTKSSRLLRQMDVPVRSHLSLLTDDQVARIRARWEREKRDRAEKQTAPPARRRRGTAAAAPAAAAPPTPAPTEATRDSPASPAPPTSRATLASPQRTMPTSRSAFPSSPTPITESRSSTSRRPSRRRRGEPVERASPPAESSPSATASAARCGCTAGTAARTRFETAPPRRPANAAGASARSSHASGRRRSRPSASASDRSGCATPASRWQQHAVRSAASRRVGCAAVAPCTPRRDDRSQQQRGGGGQGGGGGGGGGSQGGGGQQQQHSTSSNSRAPQEGQARCGRSGSGVREHLEDDVRDARTVPPVVAARGGPTRSHRVRSWRRSARRI